jgi:hypothetical protein
MFVLGQTMLKTGIQPANIPIGTITDKRLTKMKLAKRDIMQIEGQLMRQLFLNVVIVLWFVMPVVMRSSLVLYLLPLISTLNQREL